MLLSSLAQSWRFLTRAISSPVAFSPSPVALNRHVLILSLSPLLPTLASLTASFRTSFNSLKVTFRRQFTHLNVIVTGVYFIYLLFSIITSDSCAGATIQYFYDNVCSLYVGSSELTASLEKCTESYHDARGRPVYTSLTCAARAQHDIKLVKGISLEA